MKKIISHLNNGLNFKHFILIAFLLAGFIGYGQPALWTEDFSTGANYSVTLGAEGENGSSDYFIRTDDNTGHDIGVNYSNTNGYFFAGQDIDDNGWSGSDNPSELTWTGINISGYTSLSFSGNFASYATSEIDASDYVHIQYRIDGGSWTDLIWFENDGSTYNTEFGEDTDFNGDSDGADLTSAFATFTKSLSGTGSSLDIRITCAMNSGGEDFAFDEFEIYGTAVGNQAPIISNIIQTPSSGITSSTTVSVSADVTDDVSVNNVELHWGTTSGSLGNTINMSNTTGDTYETDTDIPTQTDGSTVYYEIYAEDNNSPIASQTSSEQSYQVTDQPTTNNIWINEIHYDNNGTDQDEFIEIALIDASNYTLSDFTIYLYNGSDNETYDSKTLNQFTAGTTYDNTTLYTYTYPTNGIQNGDPDGMAISWNDGSTEHLIQFLSYEGTITAINGPASGQTSVDIGVTESNSSTTVGHSLQLIDGGAKGYGDYTWSGPATATAGTENSTASDDQTLPIELTSFTAEKQNSHNLILWTTASEINNAYFTLEKSFNAKDFFEIDEIKGAGNSKSLNYYQTKDFNTDNDIIYYRLKQTDFDGSSSYSEIISIENSSELVLINNYFNGSEYVINLNSNNYNNININLYDINGRLILSETEKLNKGNNNYKFNIDNISKGIYLLNIQTKNSNINSKVFK